MTRHSVGGAGAGGVAIVTDRVWTGVVESRGVTHCFIRTLPAWERLYASASDCGMAVPPPGARVTFLRDESDPRGPRARRVVVIGGPRSQT